MREKGRCREGDRAGEEIEIITIAKHFLPSEFFIMCTDSEGSLSVEQSWKKAAMSAADADQGSPRTFTMYSPLLSSSSDQGREGFIC